MRVYAAWPFHLNLFLPVMVRYGYTLGLLFAIFKLKKYAKIYAKLKDERGRRICVASYAILMCFMGVRWFSNHIQDMEAVTMVYLYAGVGLSYVEHTKNKEVLRNEN